MYRELVVYAELGVGVRVEARLQLFHRAAVPVEDVLDRLAAELGHGVALAVLVVVLVVVLLELVVLWVVFPKLSLESGK